MYLQNKKLSILYKKLQKSLQDQQQMMLHRSRTQSPVQEAMKHHHDDKRVEDVHRATRPPMPPIRGQKKHDHEEDAPNKDVEDLDYGVLDAEA